MKRQLFGTLMMCLVLLAVLTSATFAWFTSNGKVETSRVSGKIGTQEAVLLISDKATFDGKSEAPLRQINKDVDHAKLMPVSTADLISFVFARTYYEDQAVSLAPVQDEKGLYHGRVYIKAESGGDFEGASVALYLDEYDDVGGALGENAPNSRLLSGARLGLIFNGEMKNAQILRFDKKQVGESATVIDASDAAFPSVPDPAVYLGDFSVGAKDGALPEKPLFVMEMNKTYPLDVYFYLEGCDADCTREISLAEADIHIALYGVLAEGGASS